MTESGSKLEGINPVCACGCGECPPFSRGGFAKWVKGHKSHKHKAKRYIEEYGIPVCHCGNPVGFRRGIPNKFCSRRCGGKVNGYSLPEIQQKIRENFMENHGGMMWSQTLEGREISSKSATKRFKGITLSEDHKEKISKNNFVKWEDPKYRSLRSQEQNLKNTSKFLSKWHLKMREILELSKLGFIPERYIEGYRVDEVNEEKRIIIEFNGDYWHCNPDRYSADFVVWSGKTPYTAAERWERDRQRKAKLESAGYRVIYIWESDTFEEMSDKIIF